MTAPEIIGIVLGSFWSGWSLCWLRETYRQDAERLMRQRARENDARREANFSKS